VTVVGYPGPEGSHTAAATAVLAPPGSSMEPLASFMAVVEATVGAEIGMGVLPIENSLHGPVAETHDLLYEAPLSIVSEVTLPIVHCLLARTPIQPSEVRTLRSYPVAFDQCRELVHVSGARCLASATTADAAREVAESDDPAEAAIASEEAAAHFGLTVIARDVGDHTAFTRFVGIAPYSRIEREPRWRTAMSIVTDHQPGSLYHALGPFQRHGLNLVQLVSRPIPRSMFRYRFDIVMDCHPQDAELQQALVEIREWTREVRIFGSYPATGDH
jgi:prephenate dehydratase